mgnify:CR=1 FL=1
MVSDTYIGTDLVEVSRINSAIRDSGSRFIDRIYTPIEQEYCNSKATPSIHFAGRFAAKEAVMKALRSSGMKSPIPFSSIEVLSKSSGEPEVNLLLEYKGHCKVSISHTKKHAIASAICTVE